MVDYINTGKKVKPNCDEWEDITYNKVYDVFTDGTIEFVFDDVGVRCYQSSAIFEAVDDTVDTDNTIGETNNKFKEGDKVVVVNTDYISAYDDGVRVGDIGTVIGVFEGRVDKYYVDFEDTDYECCWFFTDNCIELVVGVNTTKTLDKKYNPLEVQQSGNHYKNGEIQPIEYSERNNLSMCQGNIVKYISRHKEKNGVDDLAKVVHYALLEALFVYGEDGATELRDKIDSLINIKKTDFKYV